MKMMSTEVVWTCSEVDDDVDEKDGVREAIEGDPPRAQVVVEEGDCDGQDDQVGHEQQKHAQVPVKSEAKKSTIKLLFFFAMGLAIARCRSTIPHPKDRARN